MSVTLFYPGKLKLDYGGSIIFMSKIDGRQEKKEAILGWYNFGHA